MLPQEYTGIEAGRLELMEQRLAADVRREAAAHGQVLVAREQLSSSGNSASIITDAYEPVHGLPPSLELPSLCLASSACLFARGALLGMLATGLQMEVGMPTQVLMLHQ